MKQILVVDDVQTNLVALSFGLEEEGYEVSSATSGLEALNLAEKNQPDLVLLDVVMPDMDGFDVCQAFKNKPELSNLPIIFVSGNDSDDFVIKAMKSGARDYICKPIRYDVLSAKIDSALKNKDEHEKLNVANSTLEEMFKKNQMLLDCAGEGILGISINGEIKLSNKKAQELLRANDKALSEVTLVDLLKSHDTTSLLMNAGSKRGGERVEAVAYCLNGGSIDIEFSCSPIVDATGDASGWVFVFQDVSERKVAEKKMYELAKYDTLTGLANRYLLLETLSSALVYAKQSRSQLAVLFIDLDHFKSVNDNLGHAAGDELLCLAAESLKQCVRRDDLVARIGGDEFCVVLQNIDNPHSAMALSQEIVNRVSQPYNLSGAETYISASVGIAMYPDSAQTADDLLAAADAAMYRVKTMGRNNSQFFSQDMHNQLNEQLKIVAALHRAIDNDEFVAYFQPQMDMASSRLVGLEALSRWENPQFAYVNTQDYIELAEQYGLIAEIGQIMLDKVCYQIHNWLERGIIDDRYLVALNVSPAQLLGSDFAKSVLDALERFQVPASMLEVEVTETAMMKNPEQVISVLETLHQQGVKISVDDFGTGYSSLNYLKNLPIDTLKIDRCFVNGVNVDSADESIIKTIISLAHNLNLDVVAEGVETPDQFHFLRSLGCDRLQGYFLSKPLKESDAAVFLGNARGSLSHDS